MTPASQQLPCLVCGAQLEVRLAKGRKSGKPSLMLICPVDARHIRAFITYRPYVDGVLARLEGHTPASGDGPDADHSPASPGQPKTDSGRGGKP